MTEKLIWRRMKKNNTAGPEKLLRENEQWYVGACAKFINRDNSGDSIWTLSGKTKEPFALVINSGNSLLPVFCGRKEIPPPGFLTGLFGIKKIHSVQGPPGETAFLENILNSTGRVTKDSIDYDLMFTDKPPGEENLKAGPVNLVLRVPEFTDLDAVAALQAGYEREEVLPKGSEFYPAASRIASSKIISSSRILGAELDGRLVGKINVNAVSFTRFQIGGVYIHPDFRGRGIARRMAAEFVRSLIAQGRGVSLFVKKSNRSAQKLYDNLGFSVRGDYRISYFQV
jgi:ribosomal protein S18 acetylase RimI-like enzyme